MSGAGEGRFERLNITLGKLRLASTPVWRSPFALPSPGRSASCAGAVHPFLNVNYKTKPKPRWELHFGAMAKARQV